MRSGEDWSTETFSAGSLLLPTPSHPFKPFFRQAPENQWPPELNEKELLEIRLESANCAHPQAWPRVSV